MLDCLKKLSGHEFSAQSIISYVKDGMRSSHYYLVCRLHGFCYAQLMRPIAAYLKLVMSGRIIGWEVWRLKPPVVIVRIYWRL
jgi:hypothetical protein